MRRKITVLLVLVFILATGITIRSHIMKPIIYREHLNRAKELEAKEIYEDAIEAYKEAQVFDQDNIEIKLGIARGYRRLEDEEEFERYCLEQLQVKEPPKQILDMLMTYYKEQEDYGSAIAAVKKILESNPEHTQALKYYTTYKGSMEVLNMSYEKIDTMVDGYSVTKTGDGCGIIDGTGGEVIQAEYDWITPFSSENDLAAAGLDGKIFYINKENHKKLVPDKQYTSMGRFQDGYAKAKLKEQWGYVDESMEFVLGGKWDECTNFMEKVAAVKKDSKWTLIDTKGEKIIEGSFDHVIQDEDGTCSREKRIFASKGKKYQLYDTKGEKIGKKTFQDAKPFVTNEPAAVKIDGKWGFVDTDGRQVIQPKYDDARSFSNGLAAVKIDDEWGYIDEDNVLVIETQFKEAKEFNENGIAPVLLQEEYTLIRLVEGRGI